MTEEFDINPYLDTEKVAKKAEISDLTTTLCNSDMVYYEDTEDTGNRNISLGEIQQTIDKLKFQLEAYQKAFNRVDDLSEYEICSRKNFAEVAKELTERLTEIDQEYGEVINLC